MNDLTKLQLVTTGGAVPLSAKQLRAICANPKTSEFIVTGVSRRYLYDMLGNAPGLWGTEIHPMSAGLSGSKARGSGAGVFYTVKRKSPASQRGILVTELRTALRNLTNAVEALLLDIRVGAETDLPEETPVIAVEDLTAPQALVVDAVTTFAGLLSNVGSESEEAEGE